MRISKTKNHQGFLKLSAAKFLLTSSKKDSRLFFKCKASFLEVHLDTNASGNKTTKKITDSKTLGTTSPKREPIFIQIYAIFVARYEDKIPSKPSPIAIYNHHTFCVNRKRIKKPVVIVRRILYVPTDFFTKVFKIKNIQKAQVLYYLQKR